MRGAAAFASTRFSPRSTSSCSSPAGLWPRCTPGTSASSSSDLRPPSAGPSPPVRCEPSSTASSSSSRDCGRPAPGCPFFPTRGALGSDLVAELGIQEVACPYTGERLLAAPAIRPDVCVIHAEAADEQGNVMAPSTRDFLFDSDATLARAAEKVIVTAERIVPVGRDPQRRRAALLVRGRRRRGAARTAPGRRRFPASTGRTSTPCARTSPRPRATQTRRP